MKLSIDSDIVFHEIDFIKEDEELVRLATECLALQKKFEKELLTSSFRPDPKAAEKVSESALQALLRSGQTIDGIAKERDVSNMIIFNLQGVRDVVSNEALLALRGKLDKVVFHRIREIFTTKEELSIKNTGHFWYPPGGYIGWHTNMGLPGWRLYITYAEEPGKSFFRYRDPESSEIITAWDRGWNFRLFKIDSKRPFWHTVYSETNRYSFGYTATLAPKPAFAERIVKKAKQLLAR